MCIRDRDGLDSISLSGTNADGWYIDEAKKALEDGSISFAGKYSAPDYELILSKNCDLAIESTMIYHKMCIRDRWKSVGIVSGMRFVRINRADGNETNEK